MEIQELLKAMEAELGSEPETMVLLSKLDAKTVFEHASSKQFAMGGEHIPPKYKLLMSIAISAALGAESCMEVYTKVARNKGVSLDEIKETIMLTRFVKGTTVLNTSTNALRLLFEEEEKEEK